MKKALLYTALVSGLVVNQAKADETLIPGELVIEIQNENTFDSDDSTTENSNTFARAEYAPVININDNVFIDGVLVFEPFDQAATKNAGDDIFFQSEGAFAEELKVNYESGNVAVWAGKFNPGFGTAWDYGRGIWGEDFAEDYEITEKLGLGAAYTVETGFGSHTVSATSFFADTSFLSGSAFTKRDLTKKDDGGAANTEDFSSFTVSLDGENLFGIENLAYHLGYRSLAAGSVDTGASYDDESGFAGTLNYVFNAAENVESDLLLEYVNISNFDTASNQDNEYLTASLVNRINGNYLFSVAYTARNIDYTDATDVEDTLLQVSAGYDFDNGLTFEVGYKETEEENVQSQIIGALARYSVEF